LDAGQNARGHDQANTVDVDDVDDARWLNEKTSYVGVGSDWQLQYEVDSNQK
jgi:hypothetical protein